MSHKNKKYDWEIGSELPQLDEHSETKHLIIADYLKRYVEVYMANATIERLPLTVVDGFAGGGKYRAFNRNETTDGSPFLILKSIQEAEALLNIGRRKPRSIDAEYHFIEKMLPISTSCGKNYTCRNLRIYLIQKYTCTTKNLIK